MEQVNSHFGFFFFLDTLLFQYSFGYQTGRRTDLFL